MRPKPTGLAPSYAAQFDDPAIVAAYSTRPPYASGAVSLIVDLAGGTDGHILDLGCGTGELSRRTAPHVRAVTAIDRSARMIAEARRLPGGGARNLEWIVGPAEDLPSKRFTLVLAAESFHWFDWRVICPLLARRPNPRPLVLVERREVAPSWNSQMQPLIAKFSTNRDFQRYDLIDELVERSCYFVQGRRVFGPEPFMQSVEDYITSIHSRNGFSRDRLTAEAAFEFDSAVHSAVEPYSRNNALLLQIETRVVWGQVLDACMG